MSSQHCQHPIAQRQQPACLVELDEGLRDHSVASEIVNECLPLPIIWQLAIDEQVT